MIVSKNPGLGEHIFNSITGQFIIALARLRTLPHRMRVDDHGRFLQEGLRHGIRTDLLFAPACEENDLTANDRNPDLHIQFHKLAKILSRNIFHNDGRGIIQTQIVNGFVKGVFLYIAGFIRRRFWGLSLRGLFGIRRQNRIPL